MKAAKVMIAAAVVAFLFLAVPFASVATDAAWSESNEKAVYFEADTDKLTWEKYLAITNMSSEGYAKIIMTSMGYANIGMYKYSDMKFTVTEWYIGEASSLDDCEVTYIQVLSRSIDFEFTVKALAGGNMFIDDVAPFTSDVNDYLGVDGKVAADDTITISGTYFGNSVTKTDEKYMDFDDTFTGMYSSEKMKSSTTGIESSVKFVRGTVEKDYDFTLSGVNSTSESKVYDIGEDAESLTKDLYAYVAATSEIENQTENFFFDHKDHDSVPKNVNKVNGDSGYEEIKDVPSSTIKNENVAYTDLVISTTLSETELKNALSAVGTTSDKYSDVENAYEGIVNPAETPVNQGLFFGAFIIILVIAVVIAAIFRVKKTE